MKTMTRHCRTATLAGTALAAGLFASTGASAQTPLRNCIDTLQGMPEYSRFVGAVIRSHLVQDMRNAQAITVFAPNNAAAAKVNPALIDRVFPMEESGGPRTADPILSLAAIGVHTTNQRLPSATLTNGQSITTSGGTPLTVAVSNATPPVTTVTAANGVVATVVTAAIPCSNGAIYGIDTVLFR
ncbi:fasciclin domain-containing protein [Humitalea sp. 24SJ18S-53]|uniref:fasciclin domain-containing protein n=1 Tax=Humitalea sp. 24SJ18S-53 TaxID=3422307 RepID=UPI003D6768CB